MTNQDLSAMTQDLEGNRFETFTNSAVKSKIFTAFIATAIDFMCKTRISPCGTKEIQIPIKGDKKVMKRIILSIMQSNR